MPDSALEILAELQADIQQDAVPPLQTLTNVMATLPKKDGGTRIVAIASSLYRLLMELDSLEVKEFEAANAFANDSAKRGHRRYLRPRSVLWRLSLLNSKATSLSCYTGT